MALLVYYLIGCGIAILAIIRMFTTVFFTIKTAILKTEKYTTMKKALHAWLNQTEKGMI